MAQAQLEKRKSADPLGANYLVKNKIYIGELTFTPGGGFGKYKPIDWDYKMGEWLDLNKLPEENLYIQQGFELDAD